MSELSFFELVDARIGHARRSGAVNTFAYTAGFVLAKLPSPRAPFWPLFSRRRPAIFTLLDRDHGAGGATPKLGLGACLEAMARVSFGC